MLHIESVLYEYILYTIYASYLYLSIRITVTYNIDKFVVHYIPNTNRVLVMKGTERKHTYISNLLHI